MPFPLVSPPSRCAAAPLRRCAAAPLRRCAAAPLRLCAAAPLPGSSHGEALAGAGNAAADLAGGCGLALQAALLRSPAVC
jgi:hypothetical protein